MIQIEQGSLVATTSGGFGGGGLTTADSVVVGVVLNNDGSEDDGATVSFVLSDGRDGGESVSVPSMSQGWASWTIGQMHAGGYNCQVTVTGGDGSHIGQDEIYFDVADADSGSGGGSGTPSDAGQGSGDAGGGTSGGSGGATDSTYKPEDYRLDVGQITMQTQGGDIVHSEDEAFATERVYYYAEVVNNFAQFLGPFEVHVLVDGQDGGYGGMSHQGLNFGESFWAEGYSDPLPVGTHTLAIQVDSFEPNLFESSHSEYQLTVLPARSRRSMDEGEVAGKEGWSQRMVYITLRDYAGHGLNGNAYIEFSGPGGKTAERGEVEQGDLTLDNPWVPTIDGNMQLTVRTEIAGGLTITGNGSIDDNEGGIVKSFTQGKRVVPVTITDQNDFRVMVGERGQIGVDFKLFGLGASGEFEISSEQEWTESHSEGVTYEVWIPEDYFDDQAHDTTRSR